MVDEQSGMACQGEIWKQEHRTFARLFDGQLRPFQLLPPTIGRLVLSEHPAQAREKLR